MEKIRYTTREAQAALGIKNTKFWNEVRTGRIEVYFDGTRAYCTPETLRRYDLLCQENKTAPTNKPRAVPGVKGVKAVSV